MQGDCAELPQQALSMLGVPILYGQACPVSSLASGLSAHLESVTNVSTSESSPKKPRYTTVRLAGRPSGRTVAICTYRLWRTPLLALRARFSTSRHGAAARSGVAAAGAAISELGSRARTSLQGRRSQRGDLATLGRQAAAAAEASQCVWCFHRLSSVLQCIDRHDYPSKTRQRLKGAVGRPGLLSLCLECWHGTALDRLYKYGVSSRELAHRRAAWRAGPRHAHGANEGDRAAVHPAMH